MGFLDILVILRLDLGQISFNLVENTTAVVILTTRIVFYDILAQVTYVSKLFDF